MQEYKKRFIQFMIEAEVLRFGEFTTKSGRAAPYFINTGNYRTGEQIFKLGEFYAECIQNNITQNYNVLYGPAYKGITLAVATSAALYHKFGKNVLYSFNRKEKKEHGEGGKIVGHVPRNNDKVLIVEDVITAGTSIRESIPLLKEIADVNLTGIVISVDRMERGKGEKSAIQELKDEFGIKTYSIVTIKEIIDYLHNRNIAGELILDDNMKSKIENYLKEYGVYI